MACIGVLLACSSIDSARSKDALTREQVIDIALKEVAKRDPRYEVGEAKATLDAQGWMVVVWNPTKDPGGQRIILIDLDGAVSQYRRGL